MPEQRESVVADDPDRVHSLPETATITGLALSTLRDLIGRGEGPAVVRLSPGRVGVRRRDLRAWLDSRTISPEAA